MWLLLACVPPPPAVGPLDSLTELHEGVRARSAAPFVEVPPGGTVTLLDVDGPGKVVHFWTTFNWADRRQDTRSLSLRAWWDGELAIQTPIGDFFGAGNGDPGDLTSLPVIAKGVGFSSYWPMPFREHGKMELRNDGTVAARVYYQVDWDRLPSTRAVGPLRFQASWRREARTVPQKPFTIAEIQGRGHYVGTVLSLDPQQPGWWGEGDDLFFVDGSSSPTIQGTGTEDWVGQAWGAAEASSPYAGVVDQPGRHVSLFRWYLGDAIPFQQSLKVGMQQQGRDEFRDRSDDVSAAAFWYQTSPLTPPPELPAERIPAPPPKERWLLTGDSVPVDLSGLLNSSRFTTNHCQSRANYMLGFPTGEQVLAGVRFLFPSDCQGEATALNLSPGSAVHLNLPPGPDSLFLLLAADGPRGQPAITARNGTWSTVLRFGTHLDPYEDPWSVPEGRMVAVTEKGLGINAAYVSRLQLPPGTTSLDLEVQPGVKATLFGASRGQSRRE